MKRKLIKINLSISGFDNFNLNETEIFEVSILNCHLNLLKSSLKRSSDSRASKFEKNKSQQIIKFWFENITGIYLKSTKTDH